MIHGKKLAVIVAYDIYLECCEGNLVATWKCTPVSFYCFREALGKQMLSYSPTNQHHPGDKGMRACARQPKVHRNMSSVMSGESTRTASSLSSSTTSTPHGINKNKRDMAGNRLCGFIDDLLAHKRSIVLLKNKAHQVCHCCGKPTYHYCSLCPDKPVLHMTHREGRKTCFLHYHNTSSLGSWKEDFKLVGGKRKEWKYPNETDLAESSRQMKRLLVHNSIIQETHQPVVANAIHRDPTWNDHVI